MTVPIPQRRLIARVLLASLLAPMLAHHSLAAAPDAEASCPPMEREQTAAPVYVVLYGYPHSAQSDQRSLRQVDEDLLLMASFFDALGPRQRWVHGEAEPKLTKGFGADLRPADWRSLRASVAELSEVLSTATDPQQPEARVYLYFSGHGRQRGSGDTLGGVLFGRPEPGADAPGFNGEIDGGLIAREILAPLSKHATVHLLVDACDSAALLVTRSDEVLSPLTNRVSKAVLPPDLAERFVEHLPRVGAALAAQALTYETHEINGLFSHAIRSAAMGPADLDDDGIITYGEFHAALDALLSDAPPAGRPTVVPPALDRDALFIDWRHSPAARVCLPSSLHGTHILQTPHGRAATVRLVAGQPMRLWLPRDQPHTLVGLGRQFRQLRFVAADGLLALEGSATAADASAADATAADATAETPGGSSFAILPEPLDPTQAASPPPLAPVPAFTAPWYFGLALTGVIGDKLLTRREDRRSTTALISGRLGQARSRVAVELGWSWLAVEETIYTELGNYQRHTNAQSLIGRVGYDYLATAQDWELSLAALIGGAQRLTEGDESTPQGVLHAALLMPLPFSPVVAGRFDVRIVLMPTASALDALIQLGAGLDFEVPIER